MRKFLMMICCLAISPMAAFCQTTPNFTPKWFDDVGAVAGSAQATDVKVDASNNSYVTGNFTGTVDFDPSAAVSNLTAASGTTPGFIAKYDANGNLLWAYPLDDNGTVIPNGITVTANGSIAITGKFTATMDANPGAGTHNLSSGGGNDAFIILLDKDAGFLWAKSMGDTGEDAGNKVSSDATGNIYLAMQFQSTIKLDPTGPSYTAKGVTDGMLLKYDPAGNVIFAVDLGTASAENAASGVVVDANGSIDVIGYLNGTVDFNPLGAAFTQTAQNSLFIAQYLPDGKLSWATIIGENFTFTNGTSAFPYVIGVDAYNSICLAGSFSQYVQFLLGEVVINARGNKDIFLAQYTSGGTFSGAVNLGYAGANMLVSDIAMSPDTKSFYLSGYFTGTANFSPSGAAVLLPDHGQQDLFLAQYNTTGVALMAVSTAGNSSCNKVQANGVATTSDGDVILTGKFCSTMAFDNSTCNTNNYTAKSTANDMFLVKYSLSATITNNTISSSADCGTGAATLIGSTPQGGLGPGYTYKWRSATDGIHFTVIDGATSKDYPAPATGSATYYLREVYSDLCSPPSESNIVAVGGAVGSPIENNVIDQSSVTEGCGGAGSTGLNGSVPTGGGGVYVYQWQMSTDNFNWSNITASTLTTPNAQNLGVISFNFSFSIRRLVMTPGCSTPSISPVVPFKATQRLDKITIHATGSTEFCGSGNPGTFTGDDQPVGGNGTYTYQWKSTTSNDFQDIQGATNADYTPGLVAQTTFFKREVRSGPCYTGDPGNNSNPIIITIKSFVKITHNTIAQATPDGILCFSNANPALIAGEVPGVSTGGVGTGNYTLQWQQSTDDVHWANISGANGKDYDPPQIKQTTYYRRVVNYSDNSNCATPDLGDELVARVNVANVSNNVITQPDPDAAVICSIPADPKPISGTAATGVGFTYQWQSSLDSINFTDITGVTSQNYDPPAISRTTYYRRAAVVSGDNCVAPLYSNIISIHISASATSNAISSPRDTVFCDNGDAGVIFGTDVTGNVVHYEWQSSPDNITYKPIVDKNGPEIYQNFDPPPSTSTVYYRRQVTTDVCNTPSITRAIAIQVFETPKNVAVLQDSLTLCVGSTATLTVSTTTANAKYKWTPAVGLSATDVAAPIASPVVNTTYTVEVYTGGTCSVSASVKVTVIPKPVVNAGPDQKLFKGETAQLNGKVTGTGVQYSWSPVTYLDDPTILNPKAAPPASITYTLTAISNQGCTITTDDIHIDVFEKVTIPTAFTPNNDGKNDTWEILGLNTYPNSVLSIFNRDGTQVYRSVGYSKSWDGTFNGKPMPFGTYYYVIDLKNGFRMLSGWVALIK